MEYETIFDIQNAYPHHWTGLWFGGGLVLAFLFARFLPSKLEAPAFRENVVDWIPRQIWPNVLRPYIEILLEMLVFSIIDLLVILAPRWRWGVAAGCLILGLGIWQLESDTKRIAALLSPAGVETVEGPVTKIGSSLKFGHTQGYIEVGGRLFSYNKDDAGSPYWPTNYVIYQGQQVRLTYAGDHVVRVERQLCLLYRHCSVHYIFGVRFEFDSA